MDRTLTAFRCWLERGLSPRRNEARREFLRQQRPVILMGRGKSGTRLMAWACSKLGLSLGTSASLPAGDIDHRPFREVIKVLARRNLDVQTLGEVREAELILFQKSAYEAAHWLRLQPGGEHGWGWKWPETYLLAPYVFATFPHGRYIHMVRDGRDIAFKHHSTDDASRKLGRAVLAHLGVSGAPRYLQNAVSWEFQVNSYRTFAQVIPPAQRFEMTYEQFCSDPQGMMQRIAEFLHLPMTDACRAYIDGTLTAGQIAQYRDADPVQLAAVEARIGPTLKALGYHLSMPAGSAP